MKRKQWQRPFLFFNYKVYLVKIYLKVSCKKSRKIFPESALIYLPERGKNFYLGLLDKWQMMIQCQSKTFLFSFAKKREENFFSEGWEKIFLIVCVTNFMQKMKPMNGDRSDDCSCISLTDALWNFPISHKVTKGIEFVWTSWAIFHFPIAAFSHNVIKAGDSVQALFTVRTEAIIWLILLQYVWMIVRCWSGNEREIQI